MSAEALRDAGVVVTGAGHGIGRALATRLAAEGARVVVNDLDPDAAAAVADEIGGTPVPADCSTDAGVRHLLDHASRELGRIDVFLANAGIDGAGGPDSLQTPDDVWERVLDINVMAHVRAARALVPRLARGRRRPLRRHRLGGRAAHHDRQRAVLRHQARRRRLRRVAVGHVRRPRRRSSRRSARRACRPGCSRTPARCRTCSAATAHSTPEAGRRRVGRVARRRPLPGAPAPGGGRLLRRPGQRHRPLAGGDAPAPGQGRRGRRQT